MWIRQEVPKLKVKKHYGNPFLLTIAEFDEVTLTSSGAIPLTLLSLELSKIYNLMLLLVNRDISTIFDVMNCDIYNYMFSNGHFDIL